LLEKNLARLWRLIGMMLIVMLQIALIQVIA
jgi:hypothetical protein